MSIVHARPTTRRFRGGVRVPLPPGLARRVRRAAAALAVVAGIALLAPVAAEAQTINVWSATLTVNTDAFGGGCNNSASSNLTDCSTALSDDDFVYGGTTYKVERVELTSGTLRLKLDKNIPADIGKGGRLAAGTTTLVFWPDNLQFPGSYDKNKSWSGTGITAWTDGQSVSLSLTASTNKVSIGVSPNVVAEGSSVTVTATLTRALSQAVDIPVTLADSVTRPPEAGDRGTLTKVTVPAGRTSGTGTISTAMDADGDNETFYVRMAVDSSLPSSVAPKRPNEQTVTIADSGAVVTLTASPNPVAEGSPVTVTATLSGSFESSVTVPLTLTSGTAETGDHGTASSITIAARTLSGTTTIATHQDSDTDDETFTVALGTLPPSMAGGTPSRATVIIYDVHARWLVLTPGDRRIVARWPPYPGATGYETRHRKLNSGDAWSAWTDRGTGTSVTLTGLTNGTVYEVQMRTDAVSRIVPFWEVATPTASPEPTVPTVIATARNGGAVVTWSGGGAVSHWEWTIIPLHNDAQDTGQWFSATRYGSWKASCPGGTCDQELRVPGLTNGTEYTFRVRGVNGGIAGPAGEAKATPSSGAGALGAGDAAPAGRPAIRGSAAVGAALTASADGISDADGLTNFRRNGLWAWQWIRVAAGGAETEIPGAASRRYTPGAADLGARLKVRVAFTDDRGNPHTLTSALTGAVAGPARAEIFLLIPDDRALLAMAVPVAGAARYQHRHKIHPGGAAACGAAGWGGWTTATHGYDDVTGTDYVRIPDLVNGTRYCVQVRALSGSLAGAASAARAETPAAGAAGPVPGRPAGVSATRESGQVWLSWAAAAGGPAGAWEYRRKRGTGPWGAWEMAPVAAGAKTRFAPPGLSADTAYGFQVRGFNEYGWGAASAEAAAPAAGTDVEPVSPPDAVDASSIVVVHNGSSLTASWDAPAGATHYDVTFQGNGVDSRGAWNRAGTRLTITCDIRAGHDACVGPEHAYTVGLRARNGAGGSGWVYSGAPAGLSAPDAVDASSIAVVHNGSSLSVTWEAPAGATHYDVTYQGGGTDARGAWNRAGTSLTITCDSREGYDNCVGPRHAYTVGLRARNAAGGSGWVYSGAPAAFPSLSVADATAAEPGPGVPSSLEFAVTLDPAAPGTVTVDYATADGTAAAGSDYTATSGTLTFAPGETAKTVSVPVLPDGHDDGGETLTLTLSNASGARIADAAATGTITNEGPMPKAWTARFGRTVADQVIGAVAARMEAGRQPGAAVSLAGERIGLGPLFGAETPGSVGAGPGLRAGGAGGDGAAAEATRDRAEVRKEDEAQREALRLAEWLKSGTDAGSRLGGRDMSVSGAGFGAEAGAAPADRSMAGRELLLGSSFSLTAGTAGGGSAAFWGRGAVTRFDGRDGETSLNGEVATAMLGADWGRGPMTAGLILGHSRGDGGYRGASGGGTVSSTLTGLYPWGRYAVGERVTLWGVAGWGEGTLELTPENAEGPKQAMLRADLELMMGAAGLRGTLLDPGSGSGTSGGLLDGFALTGKADAMGVRTSTGRGRGADGGTLASSEATVTRLRLGLEASRPIALGDPGSGSGAGGATLTPSLEIGVRQDGGDAETGFGVDLGGGLALSDPGLGLEAELRARGLLTHEAGGFRERGLSGALHWKQRPDSDRGAKLSLTQTVGGSASGGADALLTRTTLAGLAANDNGGGDLRARRLEVTFGYGLSAFSDRFTLTPEAGAGFADSGRDWRLGLRLASAGDAAAFELSFEAVRRENANPGSGSGAGDGGSGAAEHEVGMRLTSRW